jgi:hypothetical protein
MAGPTEGEIRAAVQEAIDRSDIDIGAWTYQILQPLGYIPPEDRGPGWERNADLQLWDDLRPSQDAVLEGLIESVHREVQPIEAEVIDRIREAVVRAALAFAAQYPDAPRAERKVAA